MKEQQTVYQMLLVKPYQKEGEKKYSYTNIGIAFKKPKSDVIDMKLDLFPILVPGAFIQLKPVTRKESNEDEERIDVKNSKNKVKKSRKPKE